MITLKAPKDLRDLLKLDVFEISDSQIQLCLQHPAVEGDATTTYSFHFTGRIDIHSDRLVLPGKLAKYAHVFSYGCVFPRCRDELLPHCLDLGYIWEEEPSIVLSMVPNGYCRGWEVLRASPSKVELFQPFAGEGWNLLGDKRIKKIKEICPEIEEPTRDETHIFP